MSDPYDVPIAQRIEIQRTRPPAPRPIAEKTAAAEAVALEINAKIERVKTGTQ